MNEQRTGSLKEFNTFGIEASANKILEIGSVEEAKDFFVAGTNKRFLILGGGSNILFTQDFDGTVLLNRIKGVDLIEESDDHVILRAGAGEDWHQFVLKTIDKNYSGLENLSLIPGCVGASPMQNIGAYGVEVKDCITKVETVSTVDGSSRVFSNEDCQFDYRSSVFKTTEKNRYLITHVFFKLNKNTSLNTSYGAIKSQLETNGADLDNLTIKDVSKAVIDIRESKLPNPKEIGNSGSFFKNPIVSKAVYEGLKKRYKSMPAYQLPHGESYKLAAGWLIEQTGWKGYREGDYGVHDKQALVLVNYGESDGLDIYDLSERILRSVKKKFGVELEREVNIL